MEKFSDKNENKNISIVKTELKSTNLSKFEINNPSFNKDKKKLSNPLTRKIPSLSLIALKEEISNLIDLLEKKNNEISKNSASTINAISKIPTNGNKFISSSLLTSIQTTPIWNYKLIGKNNDSIISMKIEKNNNFSLSEIKNIPAPLQEKQVYSSYLEKDSNGKLDSFNSDSDDLIMKASVSLSNSSNNYDDPNNNLIYSLSPLSQDSSLEMSDEEKLDFISSSEDKMVRSSNDLKMKLSPKSDQQYENNSKMNMNSISPSPTSQESSSIVLETSDNEKLDFFISSSDKILTDSEISKLELLSTHKDHSLDVGNNDYPSSPTSQGSSPIFESSDEEKYDSVIFSEDEIIIDSSKTQYSYDDDVKEYSPSPLSQEPSSIIFEVSNEENPDSYFSSEDNLITNSSDLKIKLFLKSEVENNVNNEDSYSPSPTSQESLHSPSFESSNEEKYESVISSENFFISNSENLKIKLIPKNEEYNDDNEISDYENSPSPTSQKSSPIFRNNDEEEYDSPNSSEEKIIAYSNNSNMQHYQKSDDNVNIDYAYSPSPTSHESSPILESRNEENYSSSNEINDNSENVKVRFVNSPIISTISSSDKEKDDSFSAYENVSEESLPISGSKNNATVDTIEKHSDTDENISSKKTTPINEKSIMGREKVTSSISSNEKTQSNSNKISDRNDEESELKSQSIPIGEESSVNSEKGVSSSFTKDENKAIEPIDNLSNTFLPNSLEDSKINDQVIYSKIASLNKNVDTNSQYKKNHSITENLSKLPIESNKYFHANVLTNQDTAISTPLSNSSAIDKEEHTLSDEKTSTSLHSKSEVSSQFNKEDIKFLYSAFPESQGFSILQSISSFELDDGKKIDSFKSNRVVKRSDYKRASNVDTKFTFSQTQTSSNFEDEKYKFLYSTVSTNPKSYDENVKNIGNAISESQKAVPLKSSLKYQKKNVSFVPSPQKEIKIDNDLSKVKSISSFSKRESTEESDEDNNEGVRLGKGSSFISNKYEQNSFENSEDEIYKFKSKIDLSPSKESIEESSNSSTKLNKKSFRIINIYKTTEKERDKKNLDSEYLIETVYPNRIESDDERDFKTADNANVSIKNIKSSESPFDRPNVQKPKKISDNTVFKKHKLTDASHFSLISSENKKSFSQQTEIRGKSQQIKNETLHFPLSSLSVYKASLKMSSVHKESPLSSFSSHPKFGALPHLTAFELVEKRTTSLKM